MISIDCDLLDKGDDYPAQRLVLDSHERCVNFRPSPVDSNFCARSCTSFFFIPPLESRPSKKKHPRGHCKRPPHPSQQPLQFGVQPGMKISATTNT